MIPLIDIKDYTYSLPEDRIAKYPLPRRDSSKLLEFNGGKITDHTFSEIPSILPSNAMMVFNQTRVVPARLHFERATGAHIEVFCLRPELPYDYIENFASTSSCSWKCVVGNVKRWKNDEVLHLMNPGNNPEVKSLDLRAQLVRREGEAAIVSLSWDTGKAFSEVLEICGTIPIPPYLNRETQSIDLERYQTTYAVDRGSVAAPTAGLHFTEETMEQISSKGIDIEKVCLHVGAGTFLPVKCQYIQDHTMHREPFAVSTAFIEKLKRHKAQGLPLVAVGTTSVRTLESLYWAGVQCAKGIELHDIDQWEPYGDNSPSTDDISLGEALSALLDYAHKHRMTEITLGTKIIIVPGYKLRVVDILVTNFHQPQSTLLLLISAFVGDNWHSIYKHALDGGYRFLSYGDSSILFAQR